MTIKTYKRLNTVELPCGKISYCEELNPENPDNPYCYVEVEDQSGEVLPYASRRFKDAFGACCYFDELVTVCGATPPADWAKPGASS